jgi:hypothetical protein
MQARTATSERECPAQGGQHMDAVLGGDGAAHFIRPLECRPEKTAAGQFGL